MDIPSLNVTANIDEGGGCLSVCLYMFAFCYIFVLCLFPLFRCPSLRPQTEKDSGKVVRLKIMTLILKNDLPTQVTQNC